MFFIHFDLFEKHLTGENMQKKLVVRTMIAAVAFALAGGPSLPAVLPDLPSNTRNKAKSGKLLLILTASLP